MASNTAVAFSPSVLRWAREQASLTVEEVARRLGKDAQEIERWEEGSSAPTYIQLETLAYQLYKRPVAVFFFPEPPAEMDLQREFRTLPGDEISDVLPDTRLAIREALARRDSVEELCGGSNPSETFLLRTLKTTEEADVVYATSQLRDLLGIPPALQRAWRSVDAAFKAWREAVEGAGVFGFKRSLRQRSISGFCLAHSEFPVIYLNNSTPQTRQIFTLFHELAHAILSVSGITFRDDRYVDALRGRSQAVEVFCNRFAGEFLLPSSEFRGYRDVTEWTDELVRGIAEEYKVSREVVLRRALDWGLVTRDSYLRRAQGWAEQVKDRPGGGGDYYATQATYFGDAFLTLVFSQRQRGRCSIEEVAEHLDMRVPNAVRLEDYFLGRGS